MSFLDKLKKKKSFRQVDIEPRVINDNTNVQTFAQADQNAIPNTGQFIGTKAKSLTRLEALENLVAQQQQSIEALKRQVNDLTLNGSPNAQFVLDTYDNQYKNVKDIKVLNAFNADKVKIPGTSIYASMDEFRVANATTADTANTTKTVQFNGGTYTMDQLMLNYVPSGMLKAGVQFATYEEFKNYINTKIK